MKSLTRNSPAVCCSILLLDQLQNIRDRDALQGIVLHVAACMKRGLEIDSPHGWMPNGKFDDLADLVLVDAPLDSGNQRDAEPNGSKSIQRSELLFKNPRFAANDAIGFSVEAIELKVDRGTYFVQLLQESIVVRNAFGISVDHDVRNAAVFRSLHEIDDLRMDGRLAA